MDNLLGRSRNGGSGRTLQGWESTRGSPSSCPASALHPSSKPAHVKSTAGPGRQSRTGSLSGRSATSGTSLGRYTSLSTSSHLAADITCGRTDRRTLQYIPASSSGHERAREGADCDE